MSAFWLELWKFTSWALEFLFVRPFGYVSLAIGINLLSSVMLQRPFRNPIWKRTSLVILVQLLLFLAILAVAVIGEVSSNPTLPRVSNHWGLVADILDLCSVAVGAFWIWKMKGVRWFATSVLLLQMWLLLGANFIAGMALSGDWI